VWAATGFERARPAIVLAGAVVDHVVLHHTATRHGEPSAVALEGLASRAPVGVADMVVSEVLAREGAVWALGFVEDWDVRLDPTVMNKPVQHLGRAIGGVTDQPDGVEGKPFTADQALLDAPLQHGFEQPAQQIAVAETAMPVLRKGRMIGYLTVEAQSTKPAVRQIEVHLLA